MSFTRLGAILLLTTALTGCHAARQQVGSCDETDASVAPVLSCLHQKLSARQADSSGKSDAEAKLAQDHAARPSADEKSADTLTTGSLGKGKDADRTVDDSFFGRPAAETSRPLSLVQAIRDSLYASPTVGATVANTREGEAGVTTARAAYMPHLQLTTGVGQDTSGSYQGLTGVPYWDRSNIVGTQRTDGSLSGSQLLYDFGATRADVDRAVKARDAQALKSMAAIEDVTFATAQAYMVVQENRELLTLARDNLTILKGIANLVTQNESNGNGTQADVKRVMARVIDAQSTVADQEYESKFAEQKLSKLVHAVPGALAPVPALETMVPRTPAAAVLEGFEKNPNILASNASLESARAETTGLRSSQKPRLTVETEASGKNYAGQYRHTDLAMRGMLTLTYQLADGGLSASKKEAASARETAAEMKLIGDREDLEGNLRKLYLQLTSNKTKIGGLNEGVSANAKARELYREQFAGGKRSLLELLEVQSSYYAAKHNEIANRYDMRVAAYGILKNLGRLTSSLAREPGTLGEPLQSEPSVREAKLLAARRETLARVGDAPTTGAASAPLVKAAREVVSDKKPDAAADRKSAPLFGARTGEAAAPVVAAAAAPPADPQKSNPLFGAGFSLFSASKAAPGAASTAARTATAAPTMAQQSADELAARKEDALRGTYSQDSVAAPATKTARIAPDIVPPDSKKRTDEVVTAALPAPVKPVRKTRTVAPVVAATAKAGSDTPVSAFGNIAPLSGGLEPAAPKQAAAPGKKPAISAQPAAPTGGFGSSAPLPTGAFMPSASTAPRSNGSAATADRTL